MYSTIHIVDDDRSFRESTARLLTVKGFKVRAYESASAFLENLSAAMPGCILLDVQMPNISGPQLQERLLELKSSMPIIFLTGRGDIPTSVRAMKAGAIDFLTKPLNGDDLFLAIEQAMQRRRKRIQEDEKSLRIIEVVRKLTPRERQVFDHVTKGLLNKQIAFALGISLRTAKLHRQRVLQKLGAKSTAELVLIAEQLALSGESNVEIALPDCLKPPGATRAGSDVSAR